MEAEAEANAFYYYNYSLFYAGCSAAISNSHTISSVQNAYPHFIDEKIKAQRSYVICSKSHS